MHLLILTPADVTFARPNNEGPQAKQLKIKKVPNGWCIIDVYKIKHYITHALIGSQLWWHQAMYTASTVVYFIKEM